MPLPISKVSIIQQIERDASLGLHDRDWSLNSKLGECGWEAKSPKPGQSIRFLMRDISMSKGVLRETMVRFPSAPIYGIHRKPYYHLEIPRINYHTLRILRKPWEEGCDKLEQVKRVYLLHNGLNEVDDLGFYYELAKLLIDKDPAAACIIRPLPGHFTRYPFSSQFSERPLDRYLLDPSELYRQFLRYLIETQWLLSIIAPRRTYNYVAGLHLIAEANDGVEGRSSPSTLTDRIYSDWDSIFSASDKPERDPGKKIEDLGVRETVDTIRWLTGWNEHIPYNKPPTKHLPYPAVHSIGYSLGGFFSQCVFFCWPYLVSSCSTLASGGALRDVGITAFAHPEEWQSVLHGLRYELDSAMIDGRLQLKQKRLVAGIRKETFGFLHRIFYEVFLRDLKGPYANRVSEYVNRLLFIVGGNDPIVRPQSLLDASPEGGANIIQIANLGHFISNKNKTNDEWSSFWFPRVGELVKSFSERADSLLLKTCRENIWNSDRTQHEADGKRDDLVRVHQ